MPANTNPNTAIPKYIIAELRLENRRLREQNDAFRARYLSLEAEIRALRIARDVALKVCVAAGRIKC